MVGGMLWAVEVGMFITGLIAIILGRFPYRTGRPVTGVGAYVGGIIMLLPIAAGLPLRFAVVDRSFAEIEGRGAALADAIGKDLAIRIGFIILCFPTAYLSAALIYNPSDSVSRSKWLKEVENRKRKRRSKGRDDDDDDDRPRRRKRRRREEADYDDDRPRRRYEEDDDDRPRRRPDDDEDLPPPPPRHADDNDDLRHSHRPGPPPLPRG